MKLFIIILLCSTTLLFSQDYPLKHGKPTSKGIRQYVEDQGELIKAEFQDFIRDTLQDVWIYTQDFSNHDGADSLELGWYYPNEIFISTTELFVAYELADLSKVQRALLKTSNKFVKSTLIHELTHTYIHQIGKEMRSVDSMNVHRAYQNTIWFLKPHESFGRSFIEEGICEYISEKMGEILPPRRPFIPKTMKELMNQENSYNIRYKYSASVLKPFLDSMEFKKGVKILLHNSPPTYYEILDPDLYFERLRTY